MIRRNVNAQARPAGRLRMLRMLSAASLPVIQTQPGIRQTIHHASAPEELDGRGGGELDGMDPR